MVYLKCPLKRADWVGIKVVHLFLHTESNFHKAKNPKVLDRTLIASYCKIKIFSQKKDVHREVRAALILKVSICSNPLSAIGIYCTLLLKMWQGIPP